MAVFFFSGQRAKWENVIGRAGVGESPGESVGEGRKYLNSKKKLDQKI